jgi:hypothetical protein
MQVILVFSLACPFYYYLLRITKSQFDHITMKKIILIHILFFIIKLSPAQNVIEWSPDYKLQLGDFQSPSYEIGANVSSLLSSAHIDFAIQMSNLEFMSTKNFNSKVNTTFTRDTASIIAPDEITASYLLNFARYGFDLAELYARKFRKRIYEEKKATSDLSLFRKIFQEVQKEYVDRYGEMSKETEMGMKEEKLIVAHTILLSEIEDIKDFCKTCKPTKKKKRK